MTVPQKPDPPRWLFLRKFLTQGTKIASVAPSSKALSRALTCHIRPESPQTIVELGAGDGAVTRLATQHMHPESRVLAIERDPDFANALAAQVPRATAINGDVADVAAELADHDVTADQVDVVISGLPVPSLPKAVNQAVFDWLASLRGDVVFSQLTVMPWVYKPLYERLFENVAFTPVLRNVPPGGAYHCTGLKADYGQHLPGK